jgi:hypothetical protein
LRSPRRYTAADVNPLLGVALGSSGTLAFLALVATFWAIFTHMAAELVGVPSDFRSALFSTLLGLAAAEATCIVAGYALMPSIVAGAVGSYFGMRIFYRVPPLRSFVLFAASTLVTIAVFGGIVAYMTMQRSRIR